MAAIDNFMAAIRQQESGGNYTIGPNSAGASGAYQFTFGTWQQALSLAGMANTVYYSKQAYLAPASVQDAAARALMTQYYNQFGQSWFNVAEAWYGGPGAVGNPNIGGGPGFPTVGQYAQDVINIMNSLGGAPVATTPAGMPALQFPFTDQFAADVGTHYTDIIEPLWSDWQNNANELKTVLVPVPGSLV